DEDNAEHRQRILQILERTPWLTQIGSHDGDVLASHCTKERCWLAVVDSERSVRIWDVAREKYIGVPLHHPAAVRLAEFSPDGRSLATACADGGVRLWQLDTGKSDLPLEQPGATVERMVYDPTGRVLLAQSDNSMVTCWEVAGGRVV